jgi:hypothetical protein
MSDERPVLILAPTEDRLAHTAHKALTGRAVPVLRVNPADLPGDCDLQWSVMSRSGFVGPPDRRVDLQELRSALVRPGSRSAQDVSVDEERDYIESEIAATMLGLTAGLDCRVVNRLAPGAVGRLILRETAEVATSGLEPTPTLMTSDIEVALAFFRDECEGRALVAPVAACIPPERIEGEAGEAALAARRSGMIVLQAAPEGASESLWVVGGRCVCVNAVAPSVRASCRRVARRLGLELARFDLVVGPEGTVCVEISPDPDLPDDARTRGEFVQALSDLLASCSVAE